MKKLVFFKTPFRESGIEIVTPTVEEMDLVNLRIASELEEGIEAVVLGCTEIPLLLNDEVSPVPCLDTVKIHVESLVTQILE